MNSAQQLNPALEFILMSAKTGEGIAEWYNWLD
jgi:Ni2+-binding GTPase involved in maturation of urease and hydrogenase